MIPFFPSTYEDEILYSILCRYHIRSGNISYTDSIKDLYGSKYIKSVIDLPCNNERLLKNIPINIGINEFIDKFTLSNYYTAFLDKESKESVLRILTGDRGTGIHSKVGAAQKATEYHGYIKICPKCYEEEVEELGEGYLHRLHQIPEVFVCLKHSNILYRSEKPFTVMENSFIELSSIKFVPLKEAKIVSNNINKFIAIAKDIKYLLDNVIENKPIEWFSNQYKNMLRQLELCTPNGVVNLKEVKKRFNEFYGKEFLSVYNLDAFSLEGDNWIKYILRNKRYTLNPIKHILFIRFLGIEIKDIFSKKVEYKPFGSGLWVCKNKICENYNKETIRKVSIYYNSHAKKAVGRFKCDVCGYTYSRIGPDLCEDDKYKLGKTLDMGWLWQERLELLIKRNFSLNTIEKELETNQKTIKKYALKLGYTQYVQRKSMNNDYILKEEEKQKRKIEKINKKVFEYKELWLKIRAINPNMTITQLRENNITIYDYLYRYDKKWLYDNCPEKKKRYKVQNKK